MGNRRRGDLNERPNTPGVAPGIPTQITSSLGVDISTVTRNLFESLTSLVPFFQGGDPFIFGDGESNNGL